MTRADCQRMHAWGVLTMAEVRAIEGLGPAESRLVTALPWIGIGMALLGMFSAWALPGPPPTFAAAAFGPEDLKAWATGIAAAVSSLCGAVHSAVLLMRWIKSRRRPGTKVKAKPKGKRKHETPGEVAP